MDLSTYPTFCESLKQYKARSFAPFPLDIQASRSFICLTTVLEKQCTEVLFDGYTLTVMEFLSEQPFSLLHEIITQLTKVPFEGTPITALDFFRHYFQGKFFPSFGAIPTPKVDSWAKGLPERYRSLELEDQWRLFNHQDNAKVHQEDGTCEDHWSNVLDKYIIGYRRIPPEEDRKYIYNLVNTHLIPPLTEIIMAYLFTPVLSQWATKLGMIFPPHISTEAHRHDYYFKNLRYYVPILSGVGCFVFESVWWRRRDEEILAFYPPGTPMAWQNRFELVQGIHYYPKSYKLP